MSGVLVVVEHQNRNGSPALGRVSLEALAAGQHLAKQLGVECSAAVLGEGIAPLEGMSLDALTGQMQARGRDPVGGDVFENYGRR